MSFERLEEKLDKLAETTNKILVEAAKNTVDLQHHIKRTELLEMQQSNLAKQQHKMIQLLYIGAGIGIALYGPEVVKLLKVLL